MRTDFRGAGWTRLTGLDDVTASSAGTLLGRGPVGKNENGAQAGEKTRCTHNGS